MSEEQAVCWVCGDTDLVYTDVLGLHWCRTCFDEIYWGKKPPLTK